MLGCRRARLPPARLPPPNEGLLRAAALAPPLPAGVALASQIGQSVGLALACYASLAAFHLYTGYLAVRCVPLATLNPSRLELLIRLHLQQLQGEGGEQQQQQQQATDGPPAGAAQGLPRGGGGDAASQPPGRQQPAKAADADATLPSPAELAGVDPVFHSPSVCVGTPLSRLVAQLGSRLGPILQGQQQGQQPGEQQQPQQQGQQQQHGEQQQQQQGGEDQLKAWHSQQRQSQRGFPGRAPLPTVAEAPGAAASEPPLRHLLVPDGRKVHLLLHERAGAADCILGYMHACLLLSNEQRSPDSSGHGGSSGGSGGGTERIRGALLRARRLLPGLLRALEAAGWDDQKVVLEAKRRRFTW